MPEKEIALRAGLGVRGKNSLILLPGAGSLFVLGGIIIPAEYEGAAHRPPPREKSGENESCGNCRACIEACPSGAIRDSGNIDRNLCIQAFTAEARPVPAEVREKWGITLYGCQICQQVCPRNKNAPQAAETSCGVLGPSCELKKILACPDGDLRKGLFRGTVLDRSWIDPIALKRSALLAAARQMAKNILPLVAAYTGHPHPLLRETAQWAGTRIGE
jgi:epoxyqueuosine reductase